MDLQGQLENIVQRCRKGQRAAFTELFERYQPRLKYYLRRLGNGDVQTDDLLQEVWISVFSKIHRLKDDKAFAVWLYRIARNQFYSGFRQKDRFVPLDRQEQLPAPEAPEPTFDEADARKLHQALKALKPHHRDVLTLYFLEQMSYNQIAAVTEARIGTIRSRLFYAKQSLRKEMDKDNET